MRVLITGHNGYIGCVMVPMFRAAGHEVEGLDSDLFRALKLVPYKSGIPELQLDIRDVEPRHLAGFDAVIHLAALSNDALSNLDPEVTYEINHAASVRLAQLAKNAGVKRFLFSSSCSIYGKAATIWWRRTAPSRCSPPTLSRKIASNASWQSWPATSSVRLSPQRDSLRRVALPQLRPGPEQPRRVGLCRRSRSY